MTVGGAIRGTGLAATLLLLAACVSDSAPEPTPVPTTFPVAPPAAAETLAGAYLDAWVAGDYAAMHATLDPAVRERYPIEQFTELHAAFAEMARVTDITASAGEPRLVALAPERHRDSVTRRNPSAAP